jgi:hypothetical protein
MSSDNTSIEAVIPEKYALSVFPSLLLLNAALGAHCLSSLTGDYVTVASAGRYRRNSL